MDIKIAIILLFMTIQTTANAPYCFYNDNVNRFNYTCNIDAGMQPITELNEIWGYHMEGHNDRDVTMLTVRQDAKPFFEIFSPKFCQEFSNLQYIDMSEASILKVDKDSFNGCTKLSMIKFYMNILQEIHQDTFDKCEKLSELHLSYNKFKTFPERLFKNLINLSILDLSGNYIKFLPAKIFWSQSNLRILELNYNNLNSINPAWFKNLKSLKELDLTNNEIEELPENVFSNLQNLKILTLTSNKIRVINSNSFGNHPALKTVSLKSNPIFAIDKNFILNNQIKTLNLRKIQCLEAKEYKDKASMLRSLSNCFDNFTNNDNEEFFPFTPLGLDSTAVPTKTNRLISTEATTSSSRTAEATTKATSITRRSTTATSASTTVKSTTNQLEFTTTTESTSVLESECGKSTIGQPLIVGGEDFDHGSYPWMAILVNSTADDLVCGGVLISRRKVLTAAHCIMTKSSKIYTKDDLLVVLGSHNLNKRNEESRMSVEIEDIKVHERWNPTETKYHFDIAIVVLSDEIYPNTKVAPICLTLLRSPALSVNKAMVIGYGKTGEDAEEYSKIAKQAQAPIQKLQDCISKHKDIQSIASNTTFCGGLGNGTGVCTGDSGGGLFVSYKNVYYLRGIISSSLRDHDLGCNVNAYSLFTNVTMFIKWIENIKPSEITTRVSSIKPWSPKRASKPTKGRFRHTQRLYNNLPIWRK